MPTRDLYRRSADEGWWRFPIHAGKTINQYTDEWEAKCSRYVLREDAFATRHWRHSVAFYRFAFRMKAASTNERTMIAVCLTPGFVCEQTLVVETQPGERADHHPLVFLALADSFQFDWQVRQRVTTSLSNYILAPIPIPDMRNAWAFLAHSALRLTCNHAGYEPLWREQVGDAWREPRPAHTWPVLASDDERWEVRAAIDAVVADAYGLNREQYAHVLSTFSHKSYPKAPTLCLAKYDELKRAGLEAFTRKYDPYWDIPLNEDLPQPVIELPGVGEPAAPTGATNGETPPILRGEPAQLTLSGGVDYGKPKRRKKG